ncbi:glycoside hydrolase family 43 protein [Sphingobacterium oryzagri]|uniref:Glycoside hydrolase family 43 protein n=1 Tax=Sphingobacterium oryzagri TaxID=3025669 RepID=A0ABY7WBL6_9SPHI|nr:glycoside hydrolase family 43 protein [Sphingobacterium sp. KACC 22765]WDF67051.1 glycoside hydrolase family 43 protein [Sphingobacterium sp. KACC 22765]
MRYIRLMLILFAAISQENTFSQKLDKSETDMAAYLMVYFKDESHSLYFAISDDGYTFTDVNNGIPVISGDTIAEQKGIRDPYIMRGADGYFYMAMTDLHIFAKEKGYRHEEWERDGKEFGWGNNKNLVLMKSKDLIDWSHVLIRVDKSFPGWEDIGCAWAPQLIYDDVKRQTIVYFTLRFKNGLNKMYYAYLNTDMTALATEPKLLFQYPKNNTSYIDADISKIGNKYRMFYVSHDGVPGIKQAVSEKVDGGYQYDDKWYDPEKQACEAPNIWKRIGEKKWVLMYDIYGISPHNFGFSETTDFKTFKDLGRFNEGVMVSSNFVSPKHGAVVQITKTEADGLRQFWKATDYPSSN